MFDTKLLFFFSALGVFNVFVLAIYMLLRKTLQHLILALFIIAVGCRVGVSCFYFFDAHLSPFFIQIGLLSNVISGLLLYVFLGISNNQILKKDVPLLVSLPVGLFLLSIFYPFSQHFYVWDWTIRFYLHGILTLLVLASYYRFFIVVRGTRKTTLLLHHLLLFSFTMVCSAFIVSLFTTYVLGPVLFSVIFYGTILIFVGSKKEVKLFKKEKYANRKIIVADATDLIERIETYLYETKSFKNPNLKVKELANAINVPEHRLSQLLNDNLGVGFSNYINHFRIEEAKKLLISENRLTIEAIGNEAGFNSKTSFFTTFKSKMFCTPNTYRKQNLVQD